MALILRAVLESGKEFDPNASNPDFGTPLMLAIYSEMVEIFQLILSHPDVDVNAQEQDGWTALMLAVKAESPQMVKDLMTHPKIDPNISNHANESALDMAKKRAGFPRADECLRLIEDSLANK